MKQEHQCYIIEPEDGSQSVIDGKLYVMCDCDYMDICPNGKPAGSNRCTIRIDIGRLNSKEIKRLQECQR